MRSCGEKTDSILGGGAKEVEFRNELRLLIPQPLSLLLVFCPQGPFGEHRSRYLQVRRQRCHLWGGRRITPNALITLMRLILGLLRSLFLKEKEGGVRERGKKAKIVTLFQREKLRQKWGTNLTLRLDLRRMVSIPIFSVPFKSPNYLKLSHSSLTVFCRYLRVSLTPRCIKWPVD